jgi:hypothetical protein
MEGTGLEELVLWSQNDLFLDFICMVLDVNPAANLIVGSWSVRSERSVLARDRKQSINQLHDVLTTFPPPCA